MPHLSPNIFFTMQEKKKKCSFTWFCFTEQYLQGKEVTKKFNKLELQAIFLVIAFI